MRLLRFFFLAKTLLHFAIHYATIYSLVLCPNMFNSNNICKNGSVGGNTQSKMSEVFECVKRKVFSISKNCKLF